jgi:hypothetical protein
MGEAKRRTATRRLMDQGRLVGAGFTAFVAVVQPPRDAIPELQAAFYAGAQHLWASVLQGLEPGEDVTPADLARLDRVAAELMTFAQEAAARCQQQADPREAERQFAALAPADRLGDAPVEADMHGALTHIARALDRVLNGEARGAERPIGFLLLTFPFGDRSERANFVSNGADRRDVVVLLRELISRFQGQPEASGRA